MDKEKLGQIIEESDTERKAEDLKNMMKWEKQITYDMGVDKRIAMIYPLLIQIRNKDLDTLLADKQAYIGMMNSLITAISQGFQARINSPLSAVAELVFFTAVLADLVVKQITIFTEIGKINQLICKIITEKNITKYYYPIPTNDVRIILQPSPTNPPSTEQPCGLSEVSPTPCPPCPPCPEPPPCPPPDNGGGSGGGGKKINNK